MFLRKVTPLFLLEMKLYFRDVTSTLFSFLLPIVLVVVFGGSFGEYIDERGFKGIDVVVATNIVFLLANNGIMGVTAILAETKAKNTLKRYNSIGISNFLYLIILYTLMIVLSLLSFILFYTIAYFFFDATSIIAISIYNLVLTFGISLLLLAIFSLMGYILTMFFNSTKNAMLVSSSVFLVLIFSSGVAIPIESLPEIVQQIMQYTPMYIGIQMIISLWNNQLDFLKNYGFEILYLSTAFVGLFSVFLYVNRHKNINVTVGEKYEM